MKKSRRFLTTRLIFLMIPAILSAQPVQVVNGWKRSEQLKTYTPENLWDYIDGAADYFLPYKFRKLEVTEYFRSADEYIKVEIYDHQDHLNAFGIYAYERPPDVEYLSLGSESYRIHSTLNFYCAHYYVKILSHQTDTNALHTILMLAERVAGQLAGDCGGGAVTGLLPQEDRIPYTEKYYPDNYMGYGALSGALEITCKTGDEAYKVFVLEKETPAAARETMSSYLKTAGSDQQAVEGQIIRVDDLFQGTVFLLLTHNRLCGIYETENREIAEKVLNKMDQD